MGQITVMYQIQVMQTGQTV